ncbi:MAG: RNA 2',3'-cyclic phosphodiesterase [Bacteroidales bacterium]
MLRLFLAIKFDPEPVMLDFIRRFRNSVGEKGISWVAPINWHITVKFLGDTPKERIPEITAALAEPCTCTAPIGFAVNRLGVFGSRFRPRVVWLGTESAGKLEELLGRVRQNLVPLGWEMDNQNLVPHITLARIRYLYDTKLFQDTLDRYTHVPGQQCTASDLILYESILTKKGPVYHQRALIPFSGK